MDLNRFIQERKSRWEELEQVLRQVDRSGISSLTIEEARRFGHLYRAVSSDLIQARHITANYEILRYLNSLVARAYGHISEGNQFRFHDVVLFYLKVFPGLVRENWLMIALAMVTLLTGFLFGFGTLLLDPAAGVYLIPEQHQEVLPAQRVREIEEGKDTFEADQSIAFSSFLFTHNIEVSFVAFALGITFGLGTIVVLFLNGLMLGSLAAAYYLDSVSLFFWAWILPHGVIELSCIIIAGGAGLILARGLLAPGRSSWKQTLGKEAGVAVKLILGLIPLFVLAGIIEGTISQIHEPHLPYVLKLLFALIMGLALVYYLWLYQLNDRESYSPYGKS
ncbi:MAG: stage II sporulation protein M [bacterium]